MVCSNYRPITILPIISKLIYPTNNYDDILLKKLEQYGMREESLEWFKSYLENRKQCVNINGNYSKFSEITCGVPQGHVLG